MTTEIDQKEPEIIARKMVLHAVGTSDILIFDNGSVVVDTANGRYLTEKNLRTLILHMEDWKAENTACPKK